MAASKHRTVPQRLRTGASLTLDKKANLRAAGVISACFHAYHTCWGRHVATCDAVQESVIIGTAPAPCCANAATFRLAAENIAPFTRSSDVSHTRDASLAAGQSSFWSWDSGTGKQFAVIPKTRRLRWLLRIKEDNTQYSMWIYQARYSQSQSSVLAAINISRTSYMTL